MEQKFITHEQYLYTTTDKTNNQRKRCGYIVLEYDTLNNSVDIGVSVCNLKADEFNPIKAKNIAKQRMKSVTHNCIPTNISRKLQRQCMDILNCKLNYWNKKYLF